MSKWYCIPPANYLQMLVTWPYHMIIGPHVKHNTTYRNFYKNNPGLYTMLDNGLWEGEVLKDTELLKMANLLHVDEIIAPDDKTSCLTLRYTKRFLDYITDKGQRYDFKIHGAVHGKTFSDTRKCMLKLVDMGVDIIDMPKMLGPELRLLLTSTLQERADLPIHFLGFYKEELSLLEGSSAIRSFDTSVPFKPKYGEKFNLELPYTWWNRFIIKRRIKYYEEHYGN